MPDAMISLEDVNDVLTHHVPIAADSGLKCIELEFGRNKVLLEEATRWVRPGNSINGPAMMMMADLGLYIGVLSQVGMQPMAVTTNMNINFMTRPTLTPLIGETRMLKPKGLLQTGETTFYNADSPGRIVAHCTGTYLIPPAG